MSWDPRTAIILHQPIDFHAIATKEASKSISKMKAEVEMVIATFLPLDEPATERVYNLEGEELSSSWVCYDNPAPMIQILTEMQSLFPTFKKKLETFTRGFEKALELEINSVNEVVEKLKHIMNSRLVINRTILVSREVFMQLGAVQMR